MHSKLRKALVALGAVASFGAAGLVLAAAIQGPTIEDLVNQAQAKADAMKAKVAGLDQSVEGRSQAFQSQASDLANANKSQLKKGMGMLGDLVPSAPSTSDGQMDESGNVYVAISLSMPKEALRQLARDTGKAHVYMVLQGPLNGSFVQTYKQLKEIYSEGEISGLLMDPRIFEQYHIDRVPAFISAPQDIPNCSEGIDCIRPQVPYDVVKGNITLEAALKILAEKGDAAPAAAQGALARLED